MVNSDNYSCRLQLREPSKRACPKGLPSDLSCGAPLLLSGPPLHHSQLERRATKNERELAEFDENRREKLLEYDGSMLKRESSCTWLSSLPPS